MNKVEAIPTDSDAMEDHVQMKTNDEMATDKDVDLAVVLDFQIDLPTVTGVEERVLGEQNAS